MNQSLIVYNLTLVMPAKITFPNCLNHTLWLPNLMNIERKSQLVVVMIS